MKEKESDTAQRVNPGQMSLYSKPGEVWAYLDNLLVIYIYADCSYIFLSQQLTFAYCEPGLYSEIYQYN